MHESKLQFDTNKCFLLASLIITLQSISNSFICHKPVCSKYVKCPCVTIATKIFWQASLSYIFSAHETSYLGWFYWIQSEIWHAQKGNLCGSDYLHTTRHCQLRQDERIWRLIEIYGCNIVINNFQSCISNYKLSGTVGFKPA